MSLARTSSAPFFNEKLRAGLLFLDYASALRPTNMLPKSPLLARACPKNPLEVRGALAGSRIAVRFTWMRRMGGEMKFGQTVARGVIFVSNSREVCLSVAFGTQE